MVQDYPDYTHRSLPHGVIPALSARLQHIYWSHSVPANTTDHWTQTVQATEYVRVVDLVSGYFTGSHAMSVWLFKDGMEYLHHHGVKGFQYVFAGHPLIRFETGDAYSIYVHNYDSSAHSIVIAISIHSEVA